MGEDEQKVGEGEQKVGEGEQKVGEGEQKVGEGDHPVSRQLLPLSEKRSHTTPVSHLIPLTFWRTGIPDMVPMPSDIPDIFPMPSRHVQAWVAKNRSDHSALWLLNISGYKTGVVRIGIRVSTASEEEATSSDSSTSFILRQTTWVSTSWKSWVLPSTVSWVWMI